MPRSSVLALLTAFLTIVSADGIYTKTSPVLQVDAKSYNSLIAQSNHTSILEFYAPWCGHCQNLKSAYEKAAKNLAGLAKVAAINCDEDSNKAFCGEFGVQGFPTLKTMKPGTKAGRPVVEDYQGPRTAKGIVEAMIDKIPNHVKKVQDKGLDTWLADGNDTAKAILFTEKGATSALLRAVAIDFLGGISIGQVQSKDTVTVKTFGITTFPTLVLLPGGEKPAIVHSGEMNKEAIVEFLSQITPPNPDPAPKTSKATTAAKKPKSAASSSSTASSAFSKASASHKSADSFDTDDGYIFETINLGDDLFTESPNPIVPPAETPAAIPVAVPPIPTLSTQAELVAACLSSKSGSCILVLLPKSVETDSVLPQSATDALSSMAEVADKHAKRQAKIFPFYAVTSDNEAAKLVRGGLGLKEETELEVLAVNMKRGWFRKYGAEAHGVVEVEGFIDAIKLGEGSKEKIPKGFFTEAAEEEKPEERVHNEL